MSNADLITISSFHDRSPKFLFRSIPVDNAPSLLNSKELMDTLQVVARSIPDGLRPDKAPSFLNFKELLDNLQVVARPAFRQLLISTSDQRSPTCIIADGIMSFVAIEVAKELGIPVITFRTYSASCTWTNFHLSKLIEIGEVPFPDGNLDKYITCIPGYENILRSRDLPSICRVEKPDDSLLKFLMEETSTMTRASALILNTFHELEAPVISRLNSIFTKIYTVGPLHALHKSTVEKLVRELMDSNKREKIMKSTDEFARLANDSVKQGGSSFINLEKLIEDIRSMSP
ncbi:hypothetical protein LWI28_026962 [Acer negundo]|uniref:Uncharacterized protein n=1 Tax=Acer negundo TaxID=4023 RepID=A0AAD5NET8_ACENE|nr:hypothetical protein LWI28_026962 [Acer negundo]